MIYDKKIDDERINLNSQKARIFFDKNILVHILKSNREWLNGKIIECNTDFLILIENKKGEIPIFFKEVYSIERLEDRK